MKKRQSCRLFKIALLGASLFIFSFFVLRSVFCSESVVIETAPKEYTISKETLSNFTIEIKNNTNKKIHIPSCHFPEAGGFRVKSDDIWYDLSGYFNFEVTPQPAEESIVKGERLEGYSFVPDLKGYMLEPGKAFVWDFEDVFFAYSGIIEKEDADQPLSKMEDETLALDAIFEVSYQIEKEEYVAKSNIFKIKCSKEWFNRCAKYMIYDSINQDSDRELIDEEISRLMGELNSSGDGPMLAANDLAIISNKIGDNRAVPPLIEALENNKNFQIKIEIIRALADIGDERAKQPILNILRKTAEHAGVRDDLRREAIKACGRLKIKESLPILMNFAKIEKDDYATMIFEEKEIAIRSIGEIGSNEAYGLLIEIFEKSRNKISYEWQNFCIASAEALANIGDKRAIDFLEKCLGDLKYAQWASVRKAVEDALTKLRSQ